MSDSNKMMDSSMYHPVEILLVEDNPHDARLTIEALKENRMANVRHMHHVTDGEAAINFLEKGGQYSACPTPDIVLLDLNLPKVSGIEVLRFVRSSEKLNRLPVVILTTSSAEQDIVDAYDLNVNAYITKPVDFDSFLDVIKKMETFWFSIVKLPPMPD